MTATTDRVRAMAVVDMVPGLTYRRVDYWCRAGLFGERNTHPGSGSHGVRMFDAADIRVFRVLVGVVGHGFGGQIRGATTGMDRVMAAAIADGVRDGASVLYLADGIVSTIRPNRAVFLTIDVDALCP